MKSTLVKKEKVTLSNRKPLVRLDQGTKEKIVGEVCSGLLSKRAASRKYGLPKSAIGNWLDKNNLAILLNHETFNGLIIMSESQEANY